MTNGAGLNIGMRVLHSSKCLDVNGTEEALANVRQWTCQNTSNQRGHIQISTYNGNISQGSIRLRMAHSGKCIRPTFVSDGEFYKQYTCANTISEMFQLNFEGGVDPWALFLAEAWRQFCFFMRRRESKRGSVTPGRRHKNSVKAMCKPELSILDIPAV
jgi:hypothetical protein